MEITLETIINGLAWLFGGSGLGWFITWRWQKAKAKSEAAQAEAEAKQKEAEAKTAEVDMAQKVQDTYQEMLEYKQKEVDDNHRLINELREDRDHYKKDRDELRKEVESLTKKFMEFKLDNEKNLLQMKRDIARNGRMVECMRPLLCGREGCAIRVPVTISAQGEIEKPEKHEIEPNNEF